MAKISKTAALEMIKNSKGKFFTVKFLKNNGKERILNCQYMKDQKSNDFGLVKVKEVSKLKNEKIDSWIKSFSINKLQEIRINKQTYTINK